MAQSTGRLDSWKEIARYLGRDVRTAMRWERERGLPIHRVPGPKRSAVFAYESELHDWMTRQPAADSLAARAPVFEATAKPARVSSIAAAAALIVAATGAALFVSGEASTAIADLTIRGRELQALGETGDVVWRFPVDAHRVMPGTGRWKHVGDIDGDGSTDVLAVVKTRQTDTSEEHDELLRLSDDGELRWRRAPDARLQFRDGEYGPPWISADLVPFARDGVWRIAWAVRHSVWWPSMLLVLDADGREQHRFVHSGWITSVQAPADGHALLAGGITNTHRATFLALLDPDRLDGRSPEASNSKYECLTCPAGSPVKYFVFPRTDVSERTTFPPPYGPAIQPFASGRLQLRIAEGGEPQVPETIYEFTSAYALERARYSDWYWEWHRRLEAQGLLDHGEDACPMRGHRDVRHWSPGTGWQTLSIPFS